MTDETTKAAVLACVEALIAGPAQVHVWLPKLQAILARCRHEIERPEDRG